MSHDVRDGEQAFALTEVQRKRRIRSRYAILLLMCVTAAFFSLMAAKSESPGSLLVAVPLGCIAIASGVSLGMVLSDTQESEWFGATFLVSSESITKILPSGLRIEGQWCEFDRLWVKPRPTLVFNTGAVITVSRSYPFYSELVRRAIDASGGPGSPFAMALAQAEQEARKRVPEKYRAWMAMPPRWRFYLYSQGIPAAFLLGSAVYFLIGDVDVARRALSAGLILIPLVGAGTFISLRHVTPKSNNVGK